MCLKPSIESAEGANAVSGAFQADAAEVASEVPTAEPSEAPKSITLQQLVEAANRGDKAALQQLRQALNKHPEVWQKVGDLAAHAEQTWTRLVADGKLLRQRDSGIVLWDDQDGVGVGRVSRRVGRPAGAGRLHRLLQPGTPSFVVGLRRPL